jgi:hypothetical protein
VSTPQPPARLALQDAGEKETGEERNPGRDSTGFERAAAVGREPNTKGTPHPVDTFQIPRMDGSPKPRAFNHRRTDAARRDTPTVSTTAFDLVASF